MPEMMRFCIVCMFWLILKVSAVDEFEIATAVGTADGSFAMLQKSSLRDTVTLAKPKATKAKAKHKHVALVEPHGKAESNVQQPTSAVEPTKESSGTDSVEQVPAQEKKRWVMDKDAGRDLVAKVQDAKDPPKDADNSETDPIEAEDTKEEMAAAANEPADSEDKEIKSFKIKEEASEVENLAEEESSESLGNEEVQKREEEDSASPKYHNVVSDAETREVLGNADIEDATNDFSPNESEEPQEDSKKTTAADQVEAKVSPNHEDNANNAAEPQNDEQLSQATKLEFRDAAWNNEADNAAADAEELLQSNAATKAGVRNHKSNKLAATSAKEDSEADPKDVLQSSGDALSAALKIDKDDSEKDEAAAETAEVEKKEAAAENESASNEAAESEEDAEKAEAALNDEAAVQAEEKEEDTTGQESSVNEDVESQEASQNAAEAVENEAGANEVANEAGANEGANEAGANEAAVSDETAEEATANEAAESEEAAQAEYSTDVAKDVAKGVHEVQAVAEDVTASDGSEQASEVHNEKSNKQKKAKNGAVEGGSSEGAAEEDAQPSQQAEADCTGEQHVKNVESMEAQHGQAPKKPPGAGSTSQLDSHGFATVMELKDAVQMKLFIQRVLRKIGLLVIKEERLTEFATTCSKGSGPQSFEQLSKEILEAAGGEQGCDWACLLPQGSKERKHHEFVVVAKPKMGLGLTSSLNQEGYAKVAALKDKGEMNIFIHRVINHLGLDVKDRFAVLGIIPWYDGEESVQTFAALTTEILSLALQPGKWVAIGENQ